MRPARAVWTLRLLLTTATLARAIDPITVAGGVGAALGGLWVLNGYLETCNSDWISFDVAGLKRDLDNRLYGQHIASRVIFEAVSQFLSDKNPQKPLVLSLHGAAGTGKSFVTELIAQSIYKKGMESKYVHVFPSVIDFTGPSKLAELQLELEIMGSASTCQRSLFVFDEIDDMHPTLIDVIKAHLHPWRRSDKDALLSKSIFIFLSYAGGQRITETSLQFWKAGRDRDEIQLEDLKPLLSLPVFTTDSDLAEIIAIEEHLIDVFVPFLPLEHDHVVQCAMSAMEEAGVEPKPEVAEKLAKDLVDFPKSEPIYSAKGCKTVKNKLPLYLDH